MDLNWIAWLILITILINTAIEILADVLNLSALKKEVPKEFSEVYDAEKYAQSQEYLKVRTRFGWISSIVSLSGFLLFWFIGGFEWLHQWVLSYDLAFIWNGLLYLGALSFGSYLLGLPFSLYSTFAIEERYGFNKTSIGTWISDTLKGFLLTLVIGAPLAALLLWMLQALGEFAWLYAWIAMQLFTLVLQFVAPTWIMPLFNKFTPLENGSLRDKILSFAEKVDFDLQNVLVMDGSKRSSKSNAFFTGFGKNKRIALFDTLVENHSEDELVAVLAHEIGHYKHKHIIKGMIFSMIQSLILFWLFGLFMTEPLLYEAFFMTSTPIYAGVIFFSMVLSPVNVFLSLFLNLRSRKHEFEADAFAVNKTGQKEPMMNALKKLSRDNLTNLTPHSFYVYLHYSHPPVLQRIEAIKTLE